jgi:hypothetical protein
MKPQRVLGPGKMAAEAFAAAMLAMATGALAQWLFYL